MGLIQKTKYKESRPDGLKIKLKLKIPLKGGSDKGTVKGK